MDNWHKGLGGLLVLALIYILFLQQCGTKCDPEIIEVDTVTNVTVYDTIWFDTTRYNYITVNIPKPYYDTIEVARPAGNYIDEFNTDPVYASIYEDTIKNDTLSIYYRAKVRGSLDELTFGYKIYTPYYIEKLTTITTEITREKRFQGIYIGMDVGGNKSQFSHLAPMLGLVTRRYTYDLGYNIMDNSLIVGMKAKIRLRKR